MAKCNHIPPGDRRKIGEMLSSGNPAVILKAIDLLEKECGFCIQNFFGDWLPISEVQKDTHKKLEQELWAQTALAAVNKTFDAKQWDICDFIIKLSWDILLQWRQKAPQNVRNLGINGNPDKYPGLHSDLLLSRQEFEKDLLECLLELKNAHHDYYNVVILWVFMKESNGMTRRQVAKALNIKGYATVSDRRRKGMKILLRCLTGKGWTDIP